MNRYLIITAALLIAISCNRIKITHNNQVKIIELPLQIDSTYYSTLTDSFKLDEIQLVDINYGALKPQVKMALGINHNTFHSVLYFNGCMFVSGTSLIVHDSSGFNQICNQQDLKNYFSPIETKEEALSYVYAATGLSPSYNFELKSRYRTFVDTINTTYSIKSDNGFIVNLFDYQLCGCGPHTHFMIIYEVSFEGDIRELQRVDLYEDPEEEGLCVD